MMIVVVPLEGTDKRYSRFWSFPIKDDSVRDNGYICWGIVLTGLPRCQVYFCQSSHLYSFSQRRIVGFYRHDLKEDDCAVETN